MELQVRETCLYGGSSLFIVRAHYHFVGYRIRTQLHRSLASDEDYTLFSVVIFRRVRDEFVNKCRENKFIVRDFVFSEESIGVEREELEAADVTEKELWVLFSKIFDPTSLTVTSDGTTSFSPYKLF